jgi:hypothetical protein
MLDSLRALIDADSDLVHARGGDGQTPLHLSVDPKPRTGTPFGTSELTFRYADFTAALPALISIKSTCHRH